MKPRTRLERQILAMAKHLPMISAKQDAWAWKLFKPIGYYISDRRWCTNCGHVHYADYRTLAKQLAGSEVCECCGETLKLENARNTTKNDGRLVDFIQTYKGFTVVRTFEYRVISRLGEASKKSRNELFQKWYTDEGRERIIGLDYARSIYSFHWLYDSEFSVHCHNDHATGYYAFDDVYDNTGHYVCPYARTTKKLRQRGWSNKLAKVKVDVGSLIGGLLGNKRLAGPDAEWLVKVRRTDILAWAMQRYYHELPFRSSFKVAIRNGYKIKDFQMYNDYLENLQELGKDLHNAKYVCPQDLKKAHDWSVRKCAEFRKKQKIENERRKIAEGEVQYKEKRGAFLGVHFDDGKVFVHVLQSVKEFYDEAEAMHHCVFNNEYWNAERHPDSLIMSARDKEGKRIETIEVNLKTMKLEQSRGVCNQQTPLHGEIISLVGKYMPMIQRVRNSAFSKKITV